jgi:hypothetical protein
MFKKYKYQIYGIVGFALVCMMALGSGRRDSTSWINTMFFHYLGLELTKYTAPASE